MKYKKCLRCGLNYILSDRELCEVCRNELVGIKSIFDDDFDCLLCPICLKNKIGEDEVMCDRCRLKRMHARADDENSV